MRQVRGNLALLVTIADLVNLCRELNIHRAHYIVIGGMAMIQAGYLRATEDIGRLVDSSVEEQARIQHAMMSLPDGAIREVVQDEAFVSMKLKRK